MKKLSLKAIMLIEAILIWLHPVYIYLRLIRGVRSDVLYCLLLAVNVFVILLSQKEEKQMDEYAVAAMNKAHSICFAVAFCAIVFCALLCFASLPLITMPLLCCILLAVAALLISLRGILFIWFDTKGMD